MSEARFTFDGIDPGTAGYGSVLLNGKRIALIPSPRRRVVDGGVRAGSWDFGTELGERVIDLDLTLMPDVLDSGAGYTIDNACHELAALFDPTNEEETDKGYKRLIFDVDPDRYWLAKLDGAPTPDRRGPAHASIRLPLRCADPFAYAVDETTHNGTPITVSLLGNYWCEPVLTLTCPGAYTGNITVTDDYGAVLTWNGTVAGGNTLEIDTRTYRVKKNGALAMSGVVAGSIWPRLKPGASTTLVVAGIAPSAAQLVYRDRWL